MEVVNILEATNHLVQITLEVVICKALGTTYPVTLHQILGVAVMQLQAEALNGVAGLPEVVVEGVQSIHDQTRGEQRGITVAVGNLLPGEYFREGCLRIRLVSGRSQQADTCKPLTVVEDVLLYFVPVIHADGVADVVTQFGMSTELDIGAVLYPVLLSQLDVLQLLHAHQVSLVDGSLLGDDRE